MDMHGCKIEVESVGEGCGSTFRLILPIATADNVNRSASLTAAGAINVLLVDDDIDQRVWVRRILEDAGASVTDAASTDDALDLCTKRDLSILISDISMPGRDGYELIRDLRRARGTSGGVGAFGFRSHGCLRPCWC